MFTKRHYVELARILKNSATLEDFEELLKHYFITDNPKFSTTKFDKASKRETPDYLDFARTLAKQNM
jgi:hypothetical protein